MADTTTPHGENPTPTPAEPAAPAQATDEAPQTAPETPAASEPDWKAEARKWEQRAKDNRAQARANEEAARRLKELEDANKSEAEKTAERLAQLEKENQEFKQREQLATWTAEVAEATGVPANLLRGATKEELEAHAAELAPVLAPAETPDPPRPVPTVGQVPQTPGNVSLPEQIAAAEAAGNHELAATLKAMQLGG